MVDGKDDTCIRFSQTSRRGLAYNAEVSIQAKSPRCYLLPNLIKISVRVQDVSECQPSSLYILVEPYNKDTCDQLLMCKYKFKHTYKSVLNGITEIGATCFMSCPCPVGNLCKLRIVVVVQHATPEFKLCELRVTK